MSVKTYASGIMKVAQAISSPDWHFDINNSMLSPLSPIGIGVRDLIRYAKSPDTGYGALDLDNSGSAAGRMWNREMNDVGWGNRTMAALKGYLGALTLGGQQMGNQVKSDYLGNVMRQNAANRMTEDFKLPASVNPNKLINGVYSISDKTMGNLQHFIGRTNPELWQDAQIRARMMLDKEGYGAKAMTPELINKRALKFMMDNATDTGLSTNTRAAYAQALKGAERSYMMYTGGGNNQERVKEVASWKAPEEGTWQGVSGKVGRRAAWVYDRNGNLTRNIDPTEPPRQNISDIKDTWHPRATPGASTSGSVQPGQAVRPQMPNTQPPQPPQSPQSPAKPAQSPQPQPPPPSSGNGGKVRPASDPFW